MISQLASKEEEHTINHCLALGQELPRVPTLDALQNLNSHLVKKNCKYFDVPEQEQWRLPVLSELLQVKQQKIRLGDFSIQEVEAMIDYLCIT